MWRTGTKPKQKKDKSGNIQQKMSPAEMNQMAGEQSPDFAIENGLAFVA